MVAGHRLKFDLEIEEGKRDMIPEYIKQLHVKINIKNMPNYEKILRDEEDRIEEIFKKYKCYIPSNENDDKDEYLKFLKSLNITTKNEWRKWLLKNHSDKNQDSNEELCKKVITAGNLIYNDKN